MTGMANTPFPTSLEPLLATLVDSPPPGNEWLHEMKYDGYRTLCRIDKGNVRLITRRGLTITDRLPKIVEVISHLPIHQGWLDGEIVVLRPDGTTDFSALQNAFRRGKKVEISYFLFDILYLDGVDLRCSPLLERKKLLKSVVPSSDEVVHYADHVLGHGVDFYAEACRVNLEGIVSKRIDSAYMSGRSRHWLKTKCKQQQEFVIGGYTESSRGNLFGSLLVGLYRDGEFIFAGKIGTGYDASIRRWLLEIMRQFEQHDSPFVNTPSGPEYYNPHWLKPELVAEVKFTEITADGIRHAAFKGLREDKEAIEVTLEEPRPVAEVTGATPPQRHVGIPRERIMYPHEHLTLGDVENYYRFIADKMLPHLMGRPLTLVVCPNNIKACRYKKHGTSIPPEVRAITVAGHAQKYIMIDTLEGLLALVSIGVMEIHTWESRYEHLELPDKLVFDLDPAEETPWEKLAESALLLRNRLLELGLESFLKTTGGKGYHVVVPLLPEQSWEVTTPFAKRVAEALAQEHADRLTARLHKEHREGKIFIDWMRNGRGANAVEVYSTRARHGAAVSTPIHWEELVEGVRPDQFTLLNIRKRLETVRGDPWKDYFNVEQKIDG